MKTTKCSNCEKEIKNCNIKRHSESCNTLKNKTKLYLYEKVGAEYKCPHCEKLFNKRGISGHVWRVHSEKGKDYISKGNKKPSWNKGLTKETSEILKKKGERSKERFRLGLIIPNQLGKPHTQETKDKVSKSRIKYLQENPEKVPYLLNHSSKESYPERIFKNALVENKIECWVQEYQNGIYRYDFAFLDLKIDVEVDGSTHLTEKVKKIDERRDNWSKEQGWTVVRFTAKEVKENVTRCVNILKEIIKGLE